jgi:hypothetical protein
LFAGLKHEYKLKEAEDGEREAQKWILRLMDSLKVTNHSESFFIYVVLAIKLLASLNVGTNKGITKQNLASVVGLHSSTPSELALELTAQAFGVSVDTVERMKAQDCVVLWSLPDDEIGGVAGRPTYQLESFPEYQLAKERIALQK